MADNNSDPYIGSAVAATKDLNLSPADTARVVVEQCRRCIANAQPDDVTQQGDTPGLEHFLWGFWNEVMELALDDTTHGRLAQVLIAIKSKGDEGCAGWRVWRQPAQWGSLPVFGLVSREQMNGPVNFYRGDKPLMEISQSPNKAVLSGDLPSDDPDEQVWAKARQYWLSTNTFMARLWALDVWDGSFLAIATMRMQLEPLSLLPSPSSTLAREQKQDWQDPPELDIEVSAVWLRLAGAQMYASRELFGPKGHPSWTEYVGRAGTSGGTWNGVDGFHPDRWAHWKQILTGVVREPWRPNVIDAAQAAIDAMNGYEREDRAA